MEPLAGRPVVTFSQPGHTPFAKTATLLANGAYRVSFVVAAGGTGTATLAILARDTAGGKNRATLAISVL